MSVAALSAKEFLEDGGSPGWNLFLGKEPAPHKPVAEGGELPFDLRPVEEDTSRFGHAASRPAAER